MRRKFSKNLSKINCPLIALYDYVVFRGYPKNKLKSFWQFRLSTQASHYFLFIFKELSVDCISFFPDEYQIDALTFKLIEKAELPTIPHSNFPKVDLLLQEKTTH